MLSAQSGFIFVIPQADEKMYQCLRFVDISVEHHDVGKKKHLLFTNNQCQELLLELGP